MAKTEKPYLDKSRIDKVVSLLTLAKEHHDKAGAIFAECEEILTGEIGMGEKLKVLEAAFAGAWATRYAGGNAKRFLWNYNADRAAWKRLLRGGNTVERLAAAVDNYLRDSDSWLIKERHPFLNFVKYVNKYTAVDPSGDFELRAPVVADCKHTPPCGTDQEHTKRRMQDLGRTA